MKRERRGREHKRQRGDQTFDRERERRSLTDFNVAAVMGCCKFSNIFKYQISNISKI